MFEYKTKIFVKKIRFLYENDFKYCPSLAIYFPKSIKIYEYHTKKTVTLLKQTSY